MRTLIGIDPGQSGGIAYLITHDDGMVEHGAFKMPATPTDIIEHLEIMKNSSNNVLYLEKQHSMPMYKKELKDDSETKLQGGKSNWTFAEGYGILIGIAMTLRYKIIYVMPTVWQRHFNLLTNKIIKESKTVHKNRIKAFAQQRYPNIKVTLATADALAILEYAKDKEKS